MTRPVGLKVGNKESWPLGTALPLDGIAVLVGTRLLPVGTGVSGWLPVGIEVLLVSSEGAIVGRVLALGSSVGIPLGTSVS